MTSVIMVKDSRHSSRRVSIRGLGGQGNPGKYHRRSGFWGMTRSLPRRRQWHTTPVLLPGKYHRWRSLVSCSPWGLEESDMTERLHFHFSLLRVGEGNGNPLQCSCLENPRDGVTQSWTRLRWLSSSSSRNLPDRQDEVDVSDGENSLPRATDMWNNRSRGLMRLWLGVMCTVVE